MFLTMSLAELKNNVLALPETERHDFVVWLNRLEQNYGDVPGEALAKLSAEIWDQDDRHAPRRASDHIGLARLLETDPLKLTSEQFRASMEADLFEQ
jgi:hypothetical protein